MQDATPTNLLRTEPGLRGKQRTAEVILAGVLSRAAALQCSHVSAALFISDKKTLQL